MADYDNTLKGALFENDNKKSATHPDYKGSLETEDGTQYWVSAWIKQPRDSKKPPFLSLALTAKDAPTGQQSGSKPVASDAKSFLERNREKIDNAKASMPKSSGPKQPPKPSDFDSFDDDIPF